MTVYTKTKAEREFDASYPTKTKCKREAYLVCEVSLIDEFIVL